MSTLALQAAGGLIARYARVAKAAWSARADISPPKSAQASNASSCPPHWRSSTPPRQRLPEQWSSLSSPPSCSR